MIYPKYGTAILKLFLRYNISTQNMRYRIDKKKQHFHKEKNDEAQQNIFWQNTYNNVTKTWKQTFVAEKTKNTIPNMTKYPPSKNWK